MHSKESRIQTIHSSCSHSTTIKQWTRNRFRIFCGCWFRFLGISGHFYITSAFIRAGNILFKLFIFLYLDSRPIPILRPLFSTFSIWFELAGFCCTCSYISTKWKWLFLSFGMEYSSKIKTAQCNKLWISQVENERRKKQNVCIKNIHINKLMMYPIFSH